MDEIMKKLSENIFLERTDIETFVELAEKWIMKVDIGSMSESIEYVETSIFEWLQNNSDKDIEVEIKQINKKGEWYYLSEIVA